MSDHSHDQQEAKNPIARVLGVVFLFAVPTAMVAMLAYVGFAFVGGVRATPPPVAQAGPIIPPPTTPGGPEISPEFAELGKKSYMTCQACHGADGKGVKIGAMSMAPTLYNSELLLHENPDVPALILLKGIAKEGTEYMGMMAGLGAALDDEKMAAVLTYTRTNFGNTGTAVTTEQIAAARAKFADLEVPAGVKRAEVLKAAGAE